MRVITGTARGRRLKELEGTETRPTTEKVKEALFSAIQFDIEGRRVLDLFAGTGQLGIEALSRGAAFAVFLDQRRDAARLIRENLELTGLSDQATVLQRESLEFLSTCRETFDLIFLDPPYQTPLLEKALEKIAAGALLSPGGMIVTEHPAQSPPAEQYGKARRFRSYRYGKIAVTIYRYGEEGGEE